MLTVSQLIVIASIHQPSTTTFALFDKVLLLSGGRPQYFGPVQGVGQYFGRVGYPIPNHTNPAEFVLELLNVDFDHDQERARGRLEALQASWCSDADARALVEMIETNVRAKESVLADDSSHRNHNMASDVMTLVHRLFIKSYRDVVAYGIRIAMYLGRFQTGYDAVVAGS